MLRTLRTLVSRLPGGPALLAAVLIVCLAVVASWRISVAVDLPSGSNDYNLVRWELENVANKWLYEFGRLIRGSLDDAEKERKVEEFFALSREIVFREAVLVRADAAGRPVDEEALATLAEKRERRRELENTVEAILEERVSVLARDIGLGRSWPFFSSFRLLFPPVDFEFEGPPRVLAISPRDVIFLESRRLLRSDLTVEEVTALEEEKESEGVSALVVRVGGVGTYPSVVPPGPDYRRTLELVAHEWLHHYLYFYPLGRRYFQDEALTTINETVANIAGRELADLVSQRYHLPEPQQKEADEATTLPEEETVDFDEVMRKLRLDVERLLGEGKIDEAEALMEETRRFLAGHGHHIRKINQAYFAFHGLYADTPASSSPIGPKMLELRRLNPSLGDFIRSVADITSEDELDRLLAERAVEILTPP